MTEKSKGTPAPEAGERKKSTWTVEEATGRFTVKFASGNTTSALMGWWSQCPEFLRPVVQYGVRQMAADNAALGKDAPAADKEAAVADKLAALAAGDFTTGPALTDILQAFVTLGVAKSVDDAGKRWSGKTPEERTKLLEMDKVKLAIKAAFTARRAAQAAAALAGVSGEKVDFKL